MTSILLDAVSVKFGDVVALDHITLSVGDGEFVAVIGPSGSGKSTLLRSVAGFEQLTSGDVLFDGTVVNDWKPHERDVAMVFADNALIPHKTVRKNVSFPLDVRRVERDEVDARVMAEARTLAIDRFLERMPRQLAAGHQQLVQAARALVRRPHVFLLDEPLSRMDAATRVMMRTEIKLLQRGYDVTTLYATNDQEEAMVLADRIAVLDRGCIRQIGTPDDVYHRPHDVFVAGFVGTPAMSMLRGRVDGGLVYVADGAFPVPHGTPAGDVTVGVRPHDWHRAAGPDPTTVSGTVTAVEHHGDDAFLTVAVGDTDVGVRTDVPEHRPGDGIDLTCRRFHLFDQSGRAVAHVT